MAVVIRLARFGGIHKPRYRINVADKKFCKEGRFLETLGYYNPTPHGKEKEFELNLEKTKEWVKKGALPSDRVRKIFKQAGL